MSHVMKGRDETRNEATRGVRMSNRKRHRETDRETETERERAATQENGSWRSETGT